MSNLLQFTTTLETVTCYRCGVPFALPSDLMRRLRDTGDTFWCPSGHQQQFAETTQQRLDRARKQLDAANTRVQAVRDQADAAERSNRALRGANTKLRKRIAAGVCPCCERTFQNVARHMANQHPDILEQSSEATGD